MSNFKNILNSFNLKGTLNPKIWENPDEPKNAIMISKVRKALEKIADEFIDYLGEDVFVQDIILTGSLANFNWSEFSDFDLHVIVDFEEYGKNSDLYKELFDLKKFVFNNAHDIKIYGYDVELYAQDEKETHYASGVYSIMNNEWIKIPKKEKFDLDQKVLEEKIKCWVDKIDKAINSSTIDDDKEVLDKVKDKLKEYRKSGLEKNGELSYENLVFKFLRRSGHIEKLFDMKNKVMDKELSVERIVQESITKNPEDVVSNSTFLSDLVKLIDENLSFEYTPGQKIPKDNNVENIQSALEFLGFYLPVWGVDGKFGQETQNAVKNFQTVYGLSSNGKLEKKDLKYLVAAMIFKNFQDADLSKIKKTDSSKKSMNSLETPNNFEDVVNIIINNLEGGYYHPNMKEKNPQKFAQMGNSGETMFGMDRQHGQQETTSAGQEFWSLIDSQNAKNNWKYNYTLEDNLNLKNQLINLIVQIMEPLFYEYSDRFLSDTGKSIVMSDPKLFFNFVYATYNGPKYFQTFAKKLNDKIEQGVTDVEQLKDVALQSRKEAENSLIRSSGDKIEKIFNAMP
jgi:peptidoglycan hydrolase-like protein with peptidoglycan-binding domain/predicted nucleotidyltransferase